MEDKFLLYKDANGKSGMFPSEPGELEFKLEMREDPTLEFLRTAGMLFEHPPYNQMTPFYKETWANIPGGKRASKKVRAET